MVVGGSLSKGLDVKLDSDASIEDLAVGRYVVIQGRQKKFFSMVTDIVLDNTNAEIMSAPPDLSDPFLAEIYTGTAAYGTVHVAPMLAIEHDGDEPRPVKTVPSHFTPVYNATAEDVNTVFGQEDERHFNVGSPLELEETQVNLDLQRLVERSVGVFGKSGTGKSFLTRVILAGVIERGKAVNLVFDMHNDYGWKVRDEAGHEVKGLKQLFQTRVVIFTLDEESSRRREAPYDHVVTLAYTDIEPQDLAMLRETMDLSDPMIDAAYVLRKRVGPGWIQWLLSASADDIETMLASTSINAASLAALTRRLERFERFGFLRPQREGDSVQQIIHMLDQGKSVVLEFGRYGNALEAYILVANYLTRRIHHLYVQRMEESLAAGGREPAQLLITIEEAHKFLDPSIARQTIFGTIAREMRKYNVTLLVVDQRPSAIDEEVMSQIGTRVTALLDNERDIAAVLTGVSGAGGLREVLARLNTKQEAIILGHAVPMPVVVHTRDWGPELYAAVSGESARGEVFRSTEERQGRRRL
ncbi:MAG: ATP-binding protein [Anaerolineae bacterium]|nr:ATP-binding protein [Anaerolineae bacterium]